MHCITEDDYNLLAKLVIVIYVVGLVDLACGVMIKTVPIRLSLICGVLASVPLHKYNLPLFVCLDILAGYAMIMYVYTKCKRDKSMERIAPEIDLRQMDTDDFI